MLKGGDDFVGGSFRVLSISWPSVPAIPVCFMACSQQKRKNETQRLVLMSDIKMDWVWHTQHKGCDPRCFLFLCVVAMVTPQVTFYDKGDAIWT